MHFTLRKADAAQRLVYASIDETPDRIGEIFDYDTSKPNFETWSGEMKKASDGRNLGNVRSMHQLIAAGKLVDISFDDAAKRIDICAHIVDDAEWAKVEAGVYTGFSPGGKYVKRWKDGQHVRYTARPSEISLVDRGMIPTATFTMIKADGSSADIAVKAVSGDDLRKGLYSVSRLADLISSLSSLAESAAYEANIEQDGSPIPGRLRDWLATGVAILTDMAKEEASEELAALSALVEKLPAPVVVDTMEQADGTGDLAKAGARHSRADKDRLQAIHDHSVGMGAECAGPALKAEGTGDLAKVQGDLADATGKLAKLDTDLLAPLAKTLGCDAEAVLAKVQSLVGERDTLTKRVDELEKLPAPGGPHLKALEKADDVGGAHQAASSDATDGSFEGRLAKVQAMPQGEEKRRALIKLAETTEISRS